MKYLLSLMITSVLGQVVYAAPAGIDVRAGSDAVETRMDMIRQDILEWIAVDRAEGLQLPTRLSYPDYVSQMMVVLA